jgi:MraZ protein
VSSPHASAPVKFTHNFRHSIDAKHRLTLPSKWRFTGDDDPSAYLVVPHPDRYLVAYPPWHLDWIESRVNSLDFVDDEQDPMSVIIGSSISLGVDSQGRITLPEELLAHARIDKEAVLVGMWKSFRIESPETRAAVLGKHTMTSVGLSWKRRPTGSDRTP